ncbi:hypothetical protein MPH_06066 [Macrophomina phaseolina MS6]|uniref:Uncharacterized protein n=1 Tax=Macrophomina phaseolina (strain MS6) TaxID=1126212 RepID=K2SIR1_MACPH|nr:hypothetical protein MPH_06066 [Macrophomina phaseolina MS6]
MHDEGRKRGSFVTYYALSKLTDSQHKPKLTTTAYLVTGYERRGRGSVHNASSGRGKRPIAAYECPFKRAKLSITLYLDISYLFANGVPLKGRSNVKIVKTRCGVVDLFENELHETKWRHCMMIESFHHFTQWDKFIKNHLEGRSEALFVRLELGEFEGTPWLALKVT